MDDFHKEWYSLTPDVLIGRAQQITATGIAYNELYVGHAYSAENLEYLLRFEKPLEVVRDRWIEEQQYRPDISQEMNHTLFSVMDDPEIEHEYELDENYTPIIAPNTDMRMT